MSADAAAAFRRRRAQMRETLTDVLRLLPNERRADVARRGRDLIGSIVRRRGRPGWPLPSEIELMAELRTSRNAIREALDLLRTEGRVERVRGVGTLAVDDVYVGRCDLLHDAIQAEGTTQADDTIPAGVAPDGGAIPDEAAPPARQRHEVRHCSRLVPAPPHLVDELELTDDAVVVLERRSWIGGRPIALRTLYLAAERVPGIERADLTLDVFELLASVGVAVGRSELVIEAVAADERVAELLQVVAGSPLLLLENRTWSVDERPLFVSYGRLRSDRAALVVPKRPLPRLA